MFFISSFKKLLKLLIPNFLLVARRNLLNAKECKRLESLTPKEAFTKIYTEGLWGKSNDSGFYSGTGSHTSEIVSAYVNAVEKFLTSFEKKPDVVDLGCGDFAVGLQIRDLCANYVACDVVEQLILYNKEKFKELSVDFRVLDITTDELPTGNVVFIRQVLQHLSNKKISAVLHKLQKYRYIILTEHLPANANFDANLDIPIGAGIRLSLGKEGSGVVLTRKPFNFKPTREIILCEVSEEGGVIRTILYESC